MGHWTDDLANVSDSVRQVRATFDHRGTAFPEGRCLRSAGAFQEARLRTASAEDQLPKTAGSDDR